MTVVATETPMLKAAVQQLMQPANTYQCHIA